MLMKLLFPLALTAGSLVAAEQSPLAYRFDEVKSKVVRAPGGDEKAEARVAVGDLASSGDVVWTGFWGKAVVSVPERKSRFEISSSTRVRLAGGEPGLLLVLEKGRLKAFFEAFTDGSSGERKVGAPGVVLAVRGTRYGLEVDADGRGLLAVFEGTVEVLQTVPDAQPVRVRADELCTFGPHSAPHTSPMRSMGMSEGSWGMRSGAMGMSPSGQRGMPGMAPGGQQAPKSGSPMGGGSPMGPKGH